MTQRRYYFLVVFPLMFVGKIFGQENPCDSGKKSSIIPPISKKMISIRDCWNSNPIISANPEKIRRLLTLSIDLPEKTASSLFLYKPLSLPSYTSHLGFFCKQELQMDKISSVPLRFRLGSLEYVNWMEQKPNAVKPP